MNQKTIIAILGVAVIVLVGTTVYFATLNKSSEPIAPAPKVVQQPVPVSAPQQPTQPTDETASWQTYVNDKWGYSLRAPKNFNVNEAQQTDAPAGKTLADVAKKDVSIAGNYNGDNIIININTGSHPISDGKCDKGDFIKTLSVDSQSIEICKGENVRSDSYASIVKIDTFVQIIGDKETKQTQEIFEKIISTMKFTK